MKINKETQALIETLNKRDLIGIYRTFHENGNQKKAGVAIFLSDKTDFKIKTITRDKEGHNIMTKGSIQEEDITMVNI